MMYAAYSFFKSVITPLIIMPGTHPAMKSRSCSSVTVRAAPFTGAWPA